MGSETREGGWVAGKRGGTAKNTVKRGRTGTVGEIRQGKAGVELDESDKSIWPLVGHVSEYMGF